MNWNGVPGMARVHQVLRDLPGTDERVDPDRLVATSVELARVLRRLMQEAGFDCYRTLDGGTYFELLNSR